MPVAKAMQLIPPAISMAGEIWRFLDWHIAERCNRSLYTEPEKASCQGKLSRRMEGHHETPRIPGRGVV